MDTIYFGTCSWKYDSWRGLIYSDKKKFNYLKEYAGHFNSVEIDQWFWSLFAGDKAALPKTELAAEYAASVPDQFRFTIKVPNSITLTHHYRKLKTDLLQPNPWFLSDSLFNRFIDSIGAMHEKIGMLMFQFEYLNQEKMAGLEQFIEQFLLFLQKTGQPFPIGIEIRNPNYLKSPYFQFLQENKISHVFLQGYYMPDIADIFDLFKSRIHHRTVLRLHGGDRQKIEEKTGNQWNRIVDPRGEEISHIVRIIQDLANRRVETYINVNNHYEGSAPLTIKKIKEKLGIDSIGSS